VLKIHEAAINVLENIGIADAIPSTLEYLLPKGCKLDENGRLLFPRSLIEHTLEIAGRNFPLYAQDPQYDMEPWGTNTYFGTAGAAVYIADYETGEYRESVSQDAYDIARIVDKMEHLHFYQRAVVPRDIPEASAMDINTCYLSVSGTTKHVGTSWVHPDHLEASLKMLHEIAGGEDKWRARPFVSQSNCFVVPPLKFASDACKCLEVAVHGGMPVLLLSAGQAGATAPAAIAGALVQQVAECLAGLAYVNAIKPGAPAIFGLWCFVSDLRSGAMSGGSPEQVLLSAASAQMAHFYNLTGGTSSGISDAKFPDAQSGSEKGINHALVGNAGMNLIYEAAGMHGSLLGYSLGVWCSITTPLVRCSAPSRESKSPTSRCPLKLCALSALVDLATTWVPNRRYALCKASICTQQLEIASVQKSGKKWANQKFTMLLTRRFVKFWTTITQATFQRQWTPTFAPTWTSAYHARRWSIQT
jgi:trimethylamine--corrinoid protein Co-methyltransferase